MSMSCQNLFLKCLNETDLSTLQEFLTPANSETDHGPLKHIIHQMNSISLYQVHTQLKISPISYRVVILTLEACAVTLIIYHYF